mmetsp:Transcript_86249/g.143498  ORF Transcript_86249/g.143498 Transcript_86249/m.143498 type:complete len:206 (-) Transcript_86249:476-1093(-)
MPRITVPDRSLLDGLRPATGRLGTRESGLRAMPMHARTFPSSVPGQPPSTKSHHNICYHQRRQHLLPKPLRRARGLLFLRRLGGVLRDGGNILLQLLGLEGDHLSGARRGRRGRRHFRPHQFVQRLPRPAVLALEIRAWPVHLDGPQREGPRQRRDPSDNPSRPVALVAVWNADHPGRVLCVRVPRRRGNGDALIGCGQGLYAKE